MRYVGSALLLVILWPLSVGAQNQPLDQPDKQQHIADHWLGVSREYAESWTVAPQAEGAQPYALHEKPVFHHTQSVRGDDIGAMHLWTQPDSRPAAIGVVFAWTQNPTTRMVSYEFHSLTDDRLTLRKDKSLIWRSDAPGFQWQEFPDGTRPPPATRLGQRIVAKRMARQFKASTTTKEDERWELRQVPTAIYEYESKTAGVTYGGLFAFCQGTDTEVLLLIEARTDPEAANAKAHWRYTLLPFTDYKARVSFGGKHLWESPPGQLNENGKPHFWGFIGKSPKPEFEVQ